MKVTSYNTALHEKRGHIDTNFLFHLSDIPFLKDVAKSINMKFDNVFIFGVGGSSLAGQVLVQFKAPNSPKITFIDVLDEEMMMKVKRVDVEKSAFVFITKSGETLETLVQMNFVMAYLEESDVSCAEHCFVLTMDGTPLAQFAQSKSMKVIVHPDISGRYSCFTNVALFPAIIAGVDIDAFISGAKEECYADSDFSLDMLDFPVHVIMPYVSKLRIFTEWYSQLTAESLSKNGKGYCVLRSVGTKDQHNQLQMFIGGRDDKSYTFISCKKESHDLITNKITGVEIPSTKFSSVINAGMCGVSCELVSAKKKVRVIEFEDLTAREIGMLFMYFINEALLQAEFLAVEPFTQPDVSASKKRMFDAVSK